MWRLGKVEPTGNLLVAYATREGQVAADDTPYEAAILDALQRLEVLQFCGSVRDRVVSASRGAQEPAIYGTLGEEARYLNRPAFRGDQPRRSASKTCIGIRPNRG
jgi:hypothetical protein